MAQRRLPRAPPQWCAGVGIKGDAVTVGLFPGKLRGLRAQRPIPAEDAVVRVPFSAALSLVPYDACPFPEVVAAATYASLAPEVKMALLLLHERGKKDSRYAPYLRMLPQRLDCPAVWSREELRLLRHPHVEAEAQRMAERWRAAYDAVRASSPGFRSTWDEFAWAMMCVQSRLFSGPYTGRSLQARLSVVGAVAAVAAVYVVAGLGTAEQGLNGFISALLFNLIYDTLLSKKLEWYAMLPLVDLANHRSDAASEVAYQYFTDEFTLEVGQAYKAGDEVHVQVHGGSQGACNCGLWQALCSWCECLAWVLIRTAPRRCSMGPRETTCSFCTLGSARTTTRPTRTPLLTCRGAWGAMGPRSRRAGACASHVVRVVTHAGAKAGKATLPAAHAPQDAAAAGHGPGGRADPGVPVTRGVLGGHGAGSPGGAGVRRRPFREGRRRGGSAGQRGERAGAPMSAGRLLPGGAGRHGATGQGRATPRIDGAYARGTDSVQHAWPNAGRGGMQEPPRVPQVKDALPDRAALALRFRRQKRTLLEAAVQIMDTKDKRSQ